MVAGAAAPVLLGLVAVASVAVLLRLSRNLTFFQDDWDFLLHRRGISWGAFLRPGAEHIVVIPVAIFKALQAVFGMDSDLPFRVALALLLVLTAALLFVYVRRRLGDWLALLAAAALLFLGPAWNVLLWNVEMSVVGAMAAGIGVLLALDRDDRRGDVLACVLSVVSIGFLTLGLSFAAASAVDVWLRRRERGLARAYIPAIPLALYGLWYAGYGHEAGNVITVDNVLTSPLFLVEGVAASLSALVGVMALAGESVFQQALHWPEWALFAVVVVLVGLGLRRRTAPISRRVWVAAAAGGSFWLLAGFNEIPPARVPTASRYLYVGAILAVLVLAELFSGYRPSRRALGVATALAAFAVVVNLGPLRDGRDWFRYQADLARTDLGALEIARGSVNPSFRLDAFVAGTGSLIPIDARSYLSAVDAFGSPADTPEEIEASSEDVRAQADLLLARALPLTAGSADGRGTAAGGPPPVPEGAASAGGSPRSGSCLTLSAGTARRGAEMRLPVGGAVVRSEPGGPISLRVRRFDSRYRLHAADARGGSTTLLDIPPDRADRPWRLEVRAAQSVRVCGRAAARR